MSFAQPLPLAGLVLALVAIGLLAWRAGWSAAQHVGPPPPAARRGVLVALRAAALLSLLLILMRPVQLLPDPATRGAYVVLLDTSRSMALADSGQRSRVATAVDAIRNTIEPALAGRFVLDVTAFGDEVRQIPADELGTVRAADSASDVARALEYVSRRASSEPIAGVLVISDGGFVLPNERTAESLSVPVNTFGVGADIVARDQEVRQVTVGESSVAGATVDLTATVASTGFAGAPIEVRLLANGRPQDVRRVPPSGENVPTEVVFRVAPDPNVATRYTVETVSQEGELTVDNNRRSVLVPPPGRARRILLIEGAPGFEHSFLKRALDLDKALEIDAVIRKGANDAGDETFYVQAAPTRASALSQGFPATRQQLFAYDTIVLANVDIDALTADQMQAITDFVSERGGGLLVLGARTLEAEGIAGTMLEELIPVAVSDRQASDVVRAEMSGRSSAGVALTFDGERHPVMRLGATADETRSRWEALPPLPAVASVGGARPGATVLAWTTEPTGVSRPLVAVQRYGRGRVLAFSGEAAWRWRMMLPSSDVTYATFWRQAARWLASSAPEAVSVQTRFLGPDQVEITVDARDQEFRPVRDANVRLAVEATDGTIQNVVAAPARGESGLYRAGVRTATGVARIQVAADSRGSELGRAAAWTLVGPNEGELTAPARNDAQLVRLAGRFGGTLLTGADLSRLADGSRTQVATPAMVQRDLWHSPWILGVLIALLTGEWALRRKWGLR